MTSPKHYTISSAPTPVAPYSHAVEADNWVIITGQLPIDPTNEEAPLPDGIEAQTRLTMKNLEAVLSHVGLGFEHVLQARVFLTDFYRDYEVMNAVYSEYFDAERRPARTCIGVTGLARHALVEIDFIAKRP